MEQFEVTEYRRDKERWDRGKHWEWEGRGWKIKAAFMKKLDYMIRKKIFHLKFLQVILLVWSHIYYWLVNKFFMLQKQSKVEIYELLVKVWSVLEDG